nr:hypothetical protein [Acanthopleuribacter pedis]
MVIAAYGAGNIPTKQGPGFYSLVSVIAHLHQGGIPVVLTTQCVTGQAEPHLYQTGYYAHCAGALAGGDMLPKTAMVKLSWLLGLAESGWSQSERADHTLALMGASLCGERQVTAVEEVHPKIPSETRLQDSHLATVPPGI